MNGHRDRKYSRKCINYDSRSRGHWFVIIFLWLLAASADAAAQWVNPPTEAMLAATPGLVHETFESEFMGATVGYSVVLPPGYANNSRRYPVVYWLHGGGGNECSSLFTARSWADLYDDRQVNDVILVYPSAFRSGYMDHHDGKIMAESMIIRELIPRIDRRFRTIPSRGGRALHGFSMGASGSLKFAIKYPELFCAAVAYGGGAIDLVRSKSPFILQILERNLQSDPRLIRLNNTYHYLQQNEDRVRRNHLQVLLICGEDDSWRESAETFHRELGKRQIDCRLRLVPGVGHQMPALSAAAGSAAAIFQDRAFQNAQSRDRPFEDAYYSAAEGRWQRFEVVLPPGYAPGKQKYPLIVQQFGSSSLLPTAQQPFVRVRPSGRGVWGYRSMSRYDIMQVIDHMKEAYAIDHDRVYSTGTSAGATGIMHTAAHRPDVFAGLVPLVAFGNDLPLQNFLNLPIRCEHGVNDWTSAIGNVRVQFQRLAELGYDAALHEHPRAGHGIRVPPPRTMNWLLRQRRNKSPNRISYWCEHPRDGRAYWLTIERFVDPHQIARIEAKADSQRIKVTTHNIARLSLDRPMLPLVKGTLEVDRQEIDGVFGSQHSTVTLIKQQGEWQVRSKRLEDIQRRDYGAGAAANLFQGEPLMVAYGTGADVNENRFLKRAAELLARCGGPTFKQADVNFPVCEDAELSDLRQQKYNLLLVGTPQNHSLVREIADRLPFTIANGNLHADGRRRLALVGSVLSLHYFNPNHPRRLIYIVSPFLNANQQKQFLENPRVFLAGSEGFKMIDQPDLIVRAVDGRIRRETQFGFDWQFLRPAGADQLIPKRFAERKHLAVAHMKVMQRAAQADVALWWGPNDKGLFGGYDFNWLGEFDANHYTRADFAVRRRETETMTAVVPGEQLVDIFDRWIETKELVAWPPIARAEIESERQYRIVIPMDLVPKLGTRKKVLADVARGPELMPPDVARWIFEPAD